MTGGTSSDPVVEFDRVYRHYDQVRAVDGVSFGIGKGEFFALLGPSGSGKTTSLRLIAGFEQPDAGRILLSGSDVAHTPPHRRHVNTVFQDYALFPHMSVIDNVTYGLRMRGMSTAHARRRAQQRLELVQLGPLAERRPNQLSGGQRQRVALARALVNEPAVLLLDEPLGALDLRLREEMQSELKALQRSLGITFVLVTHDQGEALSMADRVAVFNAGRIEQIDTPRTLYSVPATEFVARFVGSANILAGESAQRLLGRAGCYALRPEFVSLGPAAGADPSLRCTGTLLDIQYRGATCRLRLAAGSDTVLHADVDSAVLGTHPPTVGTAVELTWPEHALVALRPSA